jgi:SdrD B-like domain/Pilus formation protein N terminal region
VDVGRRTAMKLRVACVAVFTIVTFASWATTVPARSKNVQRIRIDSRKSVEFIFAEPIVSVIVIDPDIATATILSDRTVRLTGLKLGQTILIILGQTQRETFAVDVVRAARATKTVEHGTEKGEQPRSFSGSQGFYFTPGLGNGPSLLRYTFDYRQQLRGSRTLRSGGELFRFFGGGDRFGTAPLATIFGANRLVFGVDTRTARFDLLDSQLATSHLGFNGYTLRGPHFVSTSASRWQGLELFAGNARPQPAIFTHGDGRLAGAYVPIWRNQRLAVRAGAVWIGPRRRNSLASIITGQRDNESGFVWQTDATCLPAENTTVSGELAYSTSGLSWRGRLDTHRGPFIFSAELSHLDRGSPVIAIGAQSEGRTNAALNFQWLPNARFHAGASYSRFSNVSTTTSTRAEVNSQILVFRTNFQPARNSHFGFTLNDQRIALPASGLVPLPLNLESRTADFKWDQRLGGKWTNNLEALLIFSREATTDEQTNRGLTLREQLRYNWRSGSAAAFINFRRTNPSLAGLVLRNPVLLPTDFRPAFNADPQGFLLRNRDALPLLLHGVELPVTRDTVSGLNFQVSLGRSSIAGEVVYGAGIFAAIPQRNLQVTVSSNLRLDAANSLQANVARVFAFSGSATQTVFTIGYVHQFGSSAGDGFQFLKLLRIGRSRIQGRVFMDSNGNGQQDTGEPGLPRIKVQLDGIKLVTTDRYGDFDFGSLDPGEYEITLISDQLGVNLRAGKATPNRISLSARETVRLSFGLTNTGSVSGRVFNDLLLARQNTAGDAPGLKGVSLILSAVDGASFSQTTTSNGAYEFRNLPPGKYVLRVNPATLPENFDVPANTLWDLTLHPLENLYLDLPFLAQRAISGIVYVDRDNDEQFDPRKDSVVAGARILAGASEGMTSRDGMYLVRNLPAGEVNVQVYSPAGNRVSQMHLSLGPEPTSRTGVNLRISAVP